MDSDIKPEIGDNDNDNDDNLEKVSSPTSSDHTSDYYESKKLSRAQRMRIRKRKLKEAAAAAAESGSRRKIIGPVLPFAACEEHLQIDV